MDRAPKIIVVMGVSGCGKTTVGKLVAEGLGCEFVEGDDYHTPENIAKMGSGQPLEDEDRRGWMAALNRKLCEVFRSGGRAVLACSALKAVYRAFFILTMTISGVRSNWTTMYRKWLADGIAVGQVRFIYIRGDFEAINQRMEERRGHYMKANMLRSQFDILEEPEGIPTYDLSLGSDLIAKQALDAFSDK